MVELDVRVGAFRLTAATPHAPPSCALRLYTTTGRVRAESPPARADPPAAHVLAFPLCLRWRERLPDTLALRAAALHIRLIPVTKPRRGPLACAPRRNTPPQLGSLRISLAELAAATVCHSLSVRHSDGTPTPYTLSFDAVVEQPSSIALVPTNIRLLASSDALPAHAPLTVVLKYPPARSTSLSTTVTPHLVKPDTDITTHLHLQEAAEESPHPSTQSGTHPANDHNLTIEADWPVLPALTLRTPGLAALAHSSIRVCVRTQNAIDVAHATLPLHAVWGALAHPHRAYRHRLLLTPQIHLLFELTADAPPPAGQMVGGVTTDAAITGARPVIFGAPIPAALRHSGAPGLPPGWLRLVDTFGLCYYHQNESAVDVWTPPPSQTAAAAIEADHARAQGCGFNVALHGIFRERQTSNPYHLDSWIHPVAVRLPGLYSPENITTSAPTSAVMDRHENPLHYHHETIDDGHDTADDSPRTITSLSTSPSGSRSVSLSRHSFTQSLSLSHSTIDASDLHPAAFSTRIKSALQQEDHERSIPVEKLGNVVEMRWIEHSPHPRDPTRDRTEGHTLTAVADGSTLLRFGGSHGSGSTRTNALRSLDTRTMRWRDVRPSGVLPAARTGHGAVALGSDRSRLLIFGGSSPQGRRNDLHTFHVANETWSPVSCAGTPPAVRARMGMTVTNGGTVALVFGGRSLYRYLGGRYYDSLYVNAFHADREQWVQMTPRGNLRPQARSGCVLEALNDRHVLLHGGYDDGDRFFEDTFIFDMVSSSWQQLPYPSAEDQPAAPDCRESHMSALMGDQVLIYGGDSHHGLLSDLQAFDCNKLRWADAPTVVGHTPGKLCSADMAAVDDSRVVLVGGDTGFRMSASTYSVEVSHRSTVDAKGLKQLARERGPDAATCVVCLDEQVDTMFLWCGHSVCCRSCSRKVKTGCPVCRKSFSQVIYNPFDSPTPRTEAAC